MPVYEYIGFDNRGHEKKGVLTSDSPFAAREKLRTMGIRASDVNLSKTSSGSSFFASLKRLLNRGSKLEVANVTRQLSTLLKSGIPLAESLDVLIKQIENIHLERVFRQILEQIVQGDSLADALEQHPYTFSSLYIAMVRSGEMSGKLDDVLERLADYTYKKQVLEEKIKATLAYPVVLMGIGFIVVCILLFAILPRITSFFTQNNIQLPLITRMFMGISSFMLSIYGVILIGMVITGIYFFKKYIETPKGDLWFSKFKLKLPLVGDLMKKSAVSKFTVTFAALLRTGIPALEGLKIVGDVMGNALMRDVIKDVQTAVIEGSDMSSKLKESGVFPPVVGYMMAVGEQSGQLEEMLERIGTAYDQEIEIASGKIISVIEPIMIVGLAIVVGGIIVSVLLPIMEMSNIKF